MTETLLEGVKLVHMNALTLWQFGGEGRLLSAAFTLPLQPIGTAPDRAATTYLYQALNEATITTASEGFPTVLATFLPTPRTLIASASGWNEPAENISCSLVNATFGNCFRNGTISNSGSPVAEVLGVARSPIASTVTVTAFVSSIMKAIIAGTVGSLVVIALVIGLLFLRQRRRQKQKIREQQIDLLPRAYEFPNSRKQLRRPRMLSTSKSDDSKSQAYISGIVSEYTVSSSTAYSAENRTSTEAEGKR
ncbi:hypothetical protein GYMLUDRAFT_251315 [Collybiopsis luxurians FD-317 M1]|uniref:Unplaced genomic scaffold GYMLUscaffold_96, whole genome shotgun sequence n=1 Tax=Collybiopsis luxurians FD-317 M1 TaxID=944289 RepID=A0A0D0BRX3_9AGAR|nr:hypothetical protein GYMLUDRAFT_251315 [Collybiopsis luxurians FD-317 M1]